MLRFILPTTHWTGIVSGDFIPIYLPHVFEIWICRSHVKDGRRKQWARILAHPEETALLLFERVDALAHIN